MDNSIYSSSDTYKLQEIISKYKTDESKETEDTENTQTTTQENETTESKFNFRFDDSVSVDVQKSFQSAFKRLDSLVSDYEEKYNNNNIEKEAYGTIKESIGNIQSLREEMNSTDISEEEKQKLSENIDQEIANIGKVVEDTKEQSGIRLKIYDNVEKLMEEGQDTEDFETTLNYAMDELDQAESDVISRQNIETQAMDRVNQKYDEYIEAAQTINDFYEAKDVSKTLAEVMTDSSNMFDSSNMYNLSRQSVTDLLSNL